MSVSSFTDWFTNVTEHSAPRRWQRELAAETTCRDRLIRIPTGLGKTEGVLGAWAYHRVVREDEAWPRRLVWCLPMRTLVEQTARVAGQFLDTACVGMSAERRPKVHLLMGGESADPWHLKPEHPAVLVGTQDMLLSRAINRGYGTGAARWPAEFGLLHQDSLWVFDEVQLMDVGLATSAQLQAFREQDRAKALRPCYSWWMSATLQPQWLATVDTAFCHDAWTRSPCLPLPEETAQPPFTIDKSLELVELANLDRKPRTTPEDQLAERVLTEHAALPDGPFGRITLVVCNTVARAVATFEALRRHGRTTELKLVHSRFRPEERKSWREFLSREACRESVDRILVTTQVVEAGVDISAGCLVTDLAPWPSLVQRFGRCARYGGVGRVVVVDRGRDDAQAAPYTSEELTAAWDSLPALTERGVGIAALEAFEAALSDEARARLYPYDPAHLLLRREFDDLFDTTPDLTGADLDVSRFIRSGDERDLQVFWTDVPKPDASERNGKPPEKSKPPAPDPSRQPHRQELCAVPFLAARNWLCGEETKSNRKPKLQAGVLAWVWDWLDGQWTPATRDALRPGRIVCVAAACGGYQVERGFDPRSKEPVPVVTDREVTPLAAALDAADGQQDDESLSQSSALDQAPATRPWKTIAAHDAEVATFATAIANRLGLSDEIREVLELVGIWHDWGKAHPAFQGSIGGQDRPSRHDLAKAPPDAWSRETLYRFSVPKNPLRERSNDEEPEDETPGDGRSNTDDPIREHRPGFRHELASALGLFALLERYAPDHPALLGPWTAFFASRRRDSEANGSTDGEAVPPPTPLIERVVALSADAFDLLVYLIACHHGKVRVALHATPADQEYRVRDTQGLPIRGVREGDTLPPVALVAGEADVPEVRLTLAPAGLGLSDRTGISWRERCQNLLAKYGPGGLAFLEAIVRAADARASQLTTPDPAFEEARV